MQPLNILTILVSANPLPSMLDSRYVIIEQECCNVGCTWCSGVSCKTFACDWVSSTVSVFSRANSTYTFWSEVPCGHSKAVVQSRSISSQEKMERRSVGTRRVRRLLLLRLLEGCGIWGLALGRTSLYLEVACWAGSADYLYFAGGRGFCGALKIVMGIGKDRKMRWSMQ